MFNSLKQLSDILKPIKVYNPQNFKPIERFSIDSRTINKLEGFIAIKGKLSDGHNFIDSAVKSQAGLIIAQNQPSQNYTLPYLQVPDSYQALSKIINFLRMKKNPYVYAITGSVGKTTTKEMLSFLLEQKLGKDKVLKNHKTENNILGVSKTLLALSNEKVVVLELGTNGFSEIATLSDIVYPDTGIITFIKPVHLEGLKSLQGIFKEKIALFNSNPKMKAVLNGDDKYLRQFSRKADIKWFGLAKNNNLVAKCINKSLDDTTFIINNKFKLVLTTPFEGFIYNALAALSGVSQSEDDLGDWVNILNQFNDFPAARMQIEKIKDFYIFNDSYNANPFAFNQVLRTLKRYPYDKIAVIADMKELGNRSIYYHRLLAKDILKTGFDQVFAIGEYVKYTCDALKTLGYDKVTHCLNHKDIADLISHDKKSEKRLIFLKGSRSMQLEKVVEYIRM